MRFNRIFKETLLMWPSTIDISDARDLKVDAGYFPGLSGAWKSVEDKTSNWSEWHQLMVWAIFCGLHKKAIEQSNKGAKVIMTEELDRDYVQSRYSESLFCIDGQNGYPGWMRRAYINDRSAITKGSK